MQATNKDNEVDDSINSMELSKFSLKPERQERLQELCWKHREMFKGLGRVEDEKHVVALKHNMKPV